MNIKTHIYKLMIEIKLKKHGVTRTDEEIQKEHGLSLLALNLGNLVSSKLNF